MKEESKIALQKAFQAAVEGQIGENVNHGWGAEDSAAAIEAIVAEDASISAAEGGELAKYSPSDPAMLLIKKVINPSAFRQVLEGAKRKDGRPVLAKSAKKAAEKAALEFFK